MIAIGLSIAATLMAEWGLVTAHDWPDIRSMRTPARWRSSWGVAILWWVIALALLCVAWRIQRA